MLSIRTDLSSLIAQNSMQTSTNKLNQAIERMTTGAKINHAKDNAANYSINTNMTTKISAYNVAANNVAMGMDMVSTASDTLSEMQNHAERLRALATQARNGTYGGQSLNAIQSEADAITKEIERLYNTAQYNGVSLFNKSEYDIPSNLPQAKSEYNGFILDPESYSQTEVEAMSSIQDYDLSKSLKYKITSAEDLAELSKIAASGEETSGVIFVLAKDIDLEEWCAKNGDWIPIADFKGTFDGNGHCIYNLTIDDDTKKDQGLFGRTKNGSIIKNVGMYDTSVLADFYAGGLVGHSSSAIINCFVVNANIKGDWAGGLAGFSYGTISDCYAKGNIRGVYVGGLVGGTSNSIQNSFTDTIVTGSFRLGGLVGYIGGITISNCYAKGAISGRGPIGGLVGEISVVSNKEANLLNCSSYVTIGDTTGYIGSFIGSVLVTNDDINFGKVNTVNCQALSQGIDLVGRCANVSGTLLPDHDISSTLAGISNTFINDVSTKLQVGIKGNDSGIITLNSNLEVDLTKLKNRITSKDALQNIEDFLGELSSKQTELGSIQNRLESVLDEILIQQDNLVASRSTIRDADIAEVSSQYIQQQILQDASATLLASTKNIQYQNVLGLLQSLQG